MPGSRIQQVGVREGLGGTLEKIRKLPKTEVLALHAHFNKGIWDLDPTEMAPCMADGYTKISERFGIGTVLTKSQRLRKLSPQTGLCGAA